MKFPPVGSEIVNLIGVIGSFLSLIGVIIAIWQILKTRRIAQAAKDASERTQKIISRNLLLSDVSTCTKNLEEIKTYVRIERYESSLIRVNDLISALVQIQQRLDAVEQNIPFEFEEMLSQLSIIRENFEKKVKKIC
jgi:acetolactate synthase small subunit